MRKKNRLTDREFEVFSDLEFMPLKVRVWEKLESLISDLRNVLIDDLLQYPLTIPAGGDGKISRGENYQSYAYRVLDLPAVFDKDDIFTFRTVILWGHPVGFHLIMAGKFQQQFQEQVFRHRKQFPSGTYLAAHEHPWIWEQTDQRWLEVHTTGEKVLRNAMEERKFLKISRFLNIEDYYQIQEFGLTTWQVIRGILFSG